MSDLGTLQLPRCVSQILYLQNLIRDTDDPIGQVRELCQLLATNQSLTMIYSFDSEQSVSVPSSGGITLAFLNRRRAEQRMVAVTM